MPIVVVVIAPNGSIPYLLFKFKEPPLDLQEGGETVVAGKGRRRRRPAQRERSPPRGMHAGLLITLAGNGDPTRIRWCPIRYSALPNRTLSMKICRGKPDLNSLDRPHLLIAMVVGSAFLAGCDIQQFGGAPSDQGTIYAYVTVVALICAAYLLKQAADAVGIVFEIAMRLSVTLLQIALALVGVFVVLTLAARL